MKQKWLVLIILILTGMLLLDRSGVLHIPRQSTKSDVDVISHAFQQKLSDVQVSGSGNVIAILKDDTRGTRHQRFIIEMDSGQTILISHNIDLAPRISGLMKGDIVEFAGEYEWNEKGGVVHWTHHDPAQKHPGGWLKHKGVIYR